MKKLLLFTLLIGGLVSCSNDPEEVALAPDSARAAVGQVPGEPNPALYSIDSTKKIVIGDKTVYNGGSITLPKGVYTVTLYTQYSGAWVYPKTKTSSSTGSIHAYDLSHVYVDGSGTLTITGLPESLFGSATIHINPQPDPMEGKVRFSIGGREVFSGDTIMLRRGYHDVNPAFYLNGEWSNFHVAASSTTGDVHMSSPNARSMRVDGIGTLTMSQPGTNVTGTIYITVPDESVKFVIDNTIEAYGNETVSLSKGSHTIYMMFAVGEGKWASLHAAVYATTGGIHMSGPNSLGFTVTDNGSLTITQPEPGSGRIAGTLYITATN